MSTASIICITGLPGAGKTLFALPFVEKLRKEVPEGQPPRPVYYFGVPGIKEKGVLNDWNEIQPFDKNDPAIAQLNNPGQIHDIETGAIILIDEAHRSFGKVSAKEVPAHISRFDMVRHNGHTILLLTQNAKSLHFDVRWRVGKHHHFFRPFGMEMSRQYEWERYADTESTKEKAEAIQSDFKFPKEVYAWYQSSDQHTIQKKLPLKIFAKIGGGIVLALALVYYAYSRLHSADADAPAAAAPAPAAAEELPPPDFSNPATRLTTMTAPKDEAAVWLSQHVERADGFPMSARFYDANWRPSTLPKISGCSHIEIDGKSRCTCNTQQGTTITTLTQEACVFYVKNGWFDPTKPDEQEGRQRNAGGPSRVEQPGMATPAPAAAENTQAMLSP